MDVLRPDHGLADTGQRAPRAATCADIYTRCVNTGRPVSEVVTASFPWCVPFTGQLADLFRAYTARKRARHLVDFDDLLLLWQAALADPAAGPVLRGMFDAVLVDEYQDVNAVQASIVRLLQPDGKQLTCVGDDAQAIYGFRGADPAHLRQLAADYPGLDIVRLDRNYRSRQGVLDLANLIRPSAPGLDLTLTGDRGPGAPPLLVRCHDEATQAREICARVLDALEDGTALRDQAVLVRAGHHSDILEIELSARKIPYVKFGGLRFTDTAHVRDFLAAARILANPADELAWFRLLRLHDGIGPATPAASWPSWRRYSGQDLPPGDWPQAAEAVPARSRPALAATLGQLAAAAGRRDPRAAAQAEAILAVLDPLIRARYPDAAARLADLRRLADAAAAQPSLHDALAELTLDPPVSGSDLAGPPRLDEDYLTISTIHAAKGLEWPIVHVPHLVDGALPSDMALGDPGGLAEEHRLFYVALTRARDHLYLYAPLRLHHHRRGRDDRHGFGQLTRFLHRDALAACDNAAAARAGSGAAGGRSDQRPGGRRARLSVGRLRRGVPYRPRAAIVYRSRATPTRRRPSAQTAISVRHRSTPVTGTARKVPAKSSAATAAPGPRVGWGDDEGQRVPADRLGMQTRRDFGPSTKPISARSPRTASATSAELTADRATATPGSAVRNAVSHAGSRYSATVMLAAIRSRESRSRRRAVAAITR